MKQDHKDFSRSENASRLCHVNIVNCNQGNFQLPTESVSQAAVIL